MSAVLPTPELRRAVRDAAQWFVRLTDKPGCARLQAACADWRAQNPVNERAWQRVTQVSTLGDALPAFAGPVLRRPPATSRRAVLRLGTVLALGMPAISLTRATAMPGAWYHAGVGEPRDWWLEDGTHLWLNSDSRIRESANEPGVLCLTRGEAMFDLSGTTHGALRVRTAHGEVQARNGRFGLRVYDDRSVAWSETDTLQVQPRAASRLSSVPAGLQVSFDTRTVEAATPWQPAQAAWRRGLLAVDDVRLDAFLAELGRHRPGLLGCDPAVAGLRLSGAFQLSDTTAVLAMLPAMLPVRVRYRTAYWVTVIPRDTRV